MYDYQPPTANPNSTYDLAYREAERRVKAKLAFRQHVSATVGVSVLVIGIYTATSIAAGNFYYFWPVWPIGAMLFGLAMHYLNTFVLANNEADRRRMIEAEMYRIQSSSYYQPTYNYTPAASPDYTSKK
jgi:hypothetical protein